MGFFTYLQLSRRPFNHKKLNDLETYSLISSMIMLIVGYFFYLQDRRGTSMVSYILSSFAIVINVIFYVLLAYNIIKSIRTNMKNVAINIKRKLSSNKLSLKPKEGI